MQRMMEHGQIGKIVLDPTMTKEEGRHNRDYFLEAERHVKGHDAQKCQHCEQKRTSSLPSSSGSQPRSELESSQPEKIEGGETMHREGKTIVFKNTIVFLVIILIVF
jgi:hypothetical protein